MARDEESRFAIGFKDLCGVCPEPEVEILRFAQDDKPILMDFLRTYFDFKNGHLFRI
jgi:hypothetical protein